MCDVSRNDSLSRLARRVAILLVTLVGVQTAALSQTPTGRLSGIVTDPSGAAVPGAQVRIKNLDSGLAKSIVTDREGRYALGGVPAGHYQVSADYSGFEAAVRDGVAVSEGSESTVALALSLGKSAAIVQVTDRAPIVGPESIAPARIRTSDAASLLGGIPGLDIYGSGGVSGIPAIHGMADERVNVLVNGMSLASACANHMNPPTSYIDPSNVGSVSVMAGLTPVSQGGDSIAGTSGVLQFVGNVSSSSNRLVYLSNDSTIDASGASNAAGKRT